jgi:SAM-dependent methyltransferase
MSNNFKIYSKYYDLLYQDKDYVSETKYIVDLIKKYAPNGKSILELGSGTGIHAALIARQNFQIVGIERSPEMVEIANKIANENISFKIADITDFNLGRSFDVALSLFHVISYLTDNKSLIQTFENVYNHLNQNGIFIFDVWHSPAVNHQVPEKRTKVIKDEEIEVVRNANPIIFPEQNVVEVNYEINIKDLKDNTNSTIDEKHPMRHFSRPEIELLAYATGFEVITSETFLTKAEPSNETWGVCYVLQKK